MIYTDKNLKQLRKKAAQVMSVYNSAVSYPEAFKLKNPSSCLVAGVDNVKGGVIAEIFDGKFAIVYFAAFEEKDRRKGYLKRCINELKKHCNLVGVNVDIFSAGDVWRKLGFTVETNFNICPTLLNITNEEFTRLNIDAGGKAPGSGLEMADVAALIGQNND